ncbi:hypothetical protein EKO04_002068 [Ascochyta lentis]|uniref:Cytochrome P450 n=1 Tax=Ascochyta lentis TaxID=205686 RepID=A0A8H7JDM6_9PLEO|nr:hypothetical protein EKO04_002068 [Ascochyta lentis]
MLFALSGLPLAIDNQLRGLFNRRVLKFHQKYGDIVRTGPNHLSIDGAIGWSEVFGHSRGSRSEFAHWNDFYQLGDSSDLSIFAADRESHRRQRRLMAHAFSDAAIKEQEILVKQHIDLLFIELRKRAASQEPVDIVKWYNYTTFDIVGDLVFAEPFNCLENTEPRAWVDMIFAGVRAGSRKQMLLNFPYLRFILQLMTPGNDEQRRLESKTMAKEKAERRVTLGPAPGGRKDIMTYILRHNDERAMSHAEVLGNTNALIVAGSETTATALSGLTYYITTNTQALKRLQDEIRTAFRSEDEITMESTAHLTYLHACIEEALRVYPPAAETPPRISQGEHVSGYYIPKGRVNYIDSEEMKLINPVQTFITIHQWANHHNPRNFTQPDAFVPERWLSSGNPMYDPQFSADRRTTFQPFSFGPRNCIGKNLAYAELRLVAARMFWNFEFELQPGCENWPDKQRVFTVWEKTPLMVRLKSVDRH